MVGHQELQTQRQLIKHAIASADEATLRYALEGTISDTQSFCRATLLQFIRRTEHLVRSPRDYGLEYVERHMLIEVAHDTLSQVSVVEGLLERIGEPRSLPPNKELRIQLREVRNLLAVHRNEHILYWRLTRTHTPHVVEVYGRFGWSLPDSGIDKEIIAYFPIPWATDEENAAGFATVGTVADVLSLPDLKANFRELDSDLTDLANKYRIAN